MAASREFRSDEKERIYPKISCDPRITSPVEDDASLNGEKRATNKSIHVTPSHLFRLMGHRKNVNKTRTADFY
jgi:hypothetical protein